VFAKSTIPLSIQHSFYYNKERERERKKERNRHTLDFPLTSRRNKSISFSSKKKIDLICCGQKRLNETNCIVIKIYFKIIA